MKLDKFKEILEDFKYITSYGKKFGLIFIIIIFLLWILSGIYVIQPEERGVLLRFGKVIQEEVFPGLHYHLPWPIEKSKKVSVTSVRKVTIGYTEKEGKIIPSDYWELQRVTGDYNIINFRMLLTYRVEKPLYYLFKVENPDVYVKRAAEAAIVRVLGGLSVDEAFTYGKVKIQQETKKIAQEILDSCLTGIRIISTNLQEISPPEEVAVGFKDVQDAKTEMEKFINEARSYYNVVTSQAKAEAYEIIKQAEAYKKNKIDQALGETSYFLKVLSEYKKNPEIYKKRKYTETIEELAKKMKKIIISPEMKGKTIIIK